MSKHTDKDNQDSPNFSARCRKQKKLPLLYALSKPYDRLGDIPHKNSCSRLSLSLKLSKLSLV